MLLVASNCVSPRLNLTQAALRVIRALNIIIMRVVVILVQDSEGFITFTNN